MPIVPTGRELLDEICYSNHGFKDLSWAAEPWWMGAPATIVKKEHASIILSFKDEKDTQRVVREGIVVFAESLTAGRYADLPRVRACDNCHSLDH